MAHIIGTDPSPEPSDETLESVLQDDDGPTIDVDLEEIETTVRISLEETQRLVDAAFAVPSE